MDTLQSDRLANAVCIFGTGRSGTTIFLNVLGAHPDLAWVSNLVERFPSRPELALFSRLYPLSLRSARKSFVRRYAPHPAESLTSLRKCSGGLFQVPRELRGDDIPSTVVNDVRKYHEQVVDYHGRPRLLLKHTGFPRFQFWRAVLSRPQFVHVVRDGRAVAHSMMRVSWWDGTMNSWWWGEMPQAYREEYEAAGRRPAVLAAIVWKHLLDIYEIESKRTPDLPVTTVRFDSFITDPFWEVAKVAEFCQLPLSAKFEDAVQSFPIRNADAAWHKELERDDLNRIEAVIGEHLARYGFT